MHEDLMRRIGTMASRDLTSATTNDPDANVARLAQAVMDLEARVARLEAAGKK